MPITSSRNPVLQEVRRAGSAGRFTADGFVVVEGPHLLSEATRGNWPIQEVFATPEAQVRHRDLFDTLNAPVVEVSARTMRTAAQTENSQGILALLCPPSFSWDRVCRQVRATAGLLMVLDGIQDPGNAGTIVRSAEAFGATAVILTNGTVRIANGKFLRGAAGSLFRLPCAEAVDTRILLGHLATERIPRLALVPQRGKKITDIDWAAGARALIVGNEAAGISRLLLQDAECCHIPIGSVESLNAGVASSVALYERSRQRGMP